MCYTQQRKMELSIILETTIMMQVWGGKELSGDSGWRMDDLSLSGRVTGPSLHLSALGFCVWGSLTSQWKKLMFWCRHTKFFLSKPKLVPPMKRGA